MPPDPARLADTRPWLIKVSADLRAAELDLSIVPPLLEDALFHCQQAAEKVLKAFLVWHDVAFRKTHDLVEIGGQCVTLDPTLEPVLRRAAILTEYAWRFRYPELTIEPTRAEAEEALALAREAVEAILQRLPPEVRR